MQWLNGFGVIGSDMLQFPLLFEVVIAGQPCCTDAISIKGKYLIFRAGIGEAVQRSEC